MKLSDIDLSDIKLAIFDFDDTLAIHEHRSPTDEDGLIRIYAEAYTNPENYYTQVEPCTKSEVMGRFIDELRRRGIKIYCLSGMLFSFHLAAKQAFVDQHYGKGIEVVFAGSQELKLYGVKIFQKIFGYHLNEILFIDDRRDVIELLTQNGVKGILASDLEA